MNRRTTWPEDLAAHIESRRQMPFAWGTNDCVMFVADGIAAMTGENPATAWPAYSTDREALRIIKKARGMRQLALKSGLRERPAAFAQRGSVVLVSLDGRETYGLVVGNGYWCAPGAEGLVFRPMSEVDAVFEV